MPKRSEEKSKVLKSNSYELKPFTTNQLTSECEYFIHSKPVYLLSYYKWCLYKSKDSTGQATCSIMTSVGYVCCFYLSIWDCLQYLDSVNNILKKYYLFYFIPATHRINVTYSIPLSAVSCLYIFSSLGSFDWIMKETYCFCESFCLPPFLSLLLTFFMKRGNAPNILSI